LTPFRRWRSLRPVDDALLEASAAWSAPGDCTPSERGEDHVVHLSNGASGAKLVRAHHAPVSVDLAAAMIPTASPTPLRARALATVPSVRSLVATGISTTVLRT
jgi:hypothetical protein